MDDAERSEAGGINAKLYLSSLALATILLVVIRIFALPHLGGASKVSISDTVISIVDSLTGASVASLCVSLLVVFFYGVKKPGATEVRITPAKSIAAELKEAANGTDAWDYRGHTGRYFRSTILPILLERSEQQGQYLTVNVQLLDPGNANLMEFFVDYRRSVNPDRRDYWTRQRAQAEIVATIMRLQVLSFRFSRLNCRVFLSSTVSPFTFDMSDTCAMVTREKAGTAALRYSAGSSFYDSIKEDMRLSNRQCAELVLRPATEVNPDSIDDVRSMLVSLGIMQGADEAFLSMTLDAYRRPVNPYASS